MLALQLLVCVVLGNRSQSASPMHAGVRTKHHVGKVMDDAVHRVERGPVWVVLPAAVLVHHRTHTSP